MHRPIRALVPLVALLLAAPTMAAPALWRFGDEDTTIYLFGTIHALPPGYEWRDDRIDKAIASADTLVVETQVDRDPAALAKLFPPPDPTLPPIIQRVPPESRKAFSALIARSGIDERALDPMPTWQAAFFLMGSMMKDLGVAREAGVESSISGGFEVPTDGKGPSRIEALETPASQLALFAELSEQEQRELLAAMVAGKGNARRDFARLLRAWARGDEAAIARLFAEDQDLTPHLREVLLRRRNENWANWLKARLDQPGTVFVAVGAGHLAGPASVQRMLAAKGIAVKRVGTSDDRRSPGN